MKNIILVIAIVALAAWTGSRLTKSTNERNAARFVLVESEWKDTREDAIRDAKLQGFVQLVDIEASTYKFELTSTKRKGGAFSVKMRVSCE